MEGKLLADSRKTCVHDDENDYEGIDEQTFDIEIERMYLAKLKEQRQKIDVLTSQYRSLKDQLDQKDQMMALQNRKLTGLTEQASFKKKYEQTFRALKQSEAECQKLNKQVQSLREELNFCVQQKNTTAKEMKGYLKQTDFKLNEELCVLREVIQEKQKTIDSLRRKQADEVKKLNEQTFKRELQIQTYQQNTSDKLKWLTEEISELNRRIDFKDEAIGRLEGEVDRWEKKAVELQQQLSNKDNEMQASNDEYKKLFQKMKFHIRSIKKELIDRDDEVCRQKQNVLRAVDSAKRADNKILDLTDQLKIQAKEHEELMSRTSFEWVQDRKNFHNTAREFKSNIEDLMKSKSQLAYENDKLHAVIKHKQSTEKVRNSISGNEHGEINKLERIIRRI